MPATEKKIVDRIRESIALKEKILSDRKLIAAIGKAAEAAYKALSKGKKIIFFGNGGSASDAQHLVAELVVRFRRERKALSAMALPANSALLTAMSNDYSFDRIFSRQIEALGASGDVAFAISTSGVSKNIIDGMKAASAKKMTVVGLLGKGGGQALKHTDIALLIPGTDTARIQESQITVGHIICEIIEERIAGAGK